MPMRKKYIQYLYIGIVLITEIPDKRKKELVFFLGLLNFTISAIVFLSTHTPGPFFAAIFDQKRFVFLSIFCHQLPNICLLSL